MAATALPRPASETPERRLLRAGFGSLWILDAILQLQPGMFQMDMISDIMQPAATGQPGWLAGSIHSSIALVTPHLFAFNVAVVLLQAAIGVALLSARPRWVRAGAMGSIAWSALVWWFGEGLGQLLTGSATLLAGAPGSVLLYGLTGVMLLLPPREPRGEPGPTPASLAAAAVLALGAVLQANPLFFTPMGLSSPFGQMEMMTQPRVIENTLGWAVSAASSAPVAVNAALIAGAGALALALALRPASASTAALASVFLFVVWWFGQDVGGLFTGMATDPNTSVPLAIWVWAGYLGARRPALTVNPDRATLRPQMR